MALHSLELKDSQLNTAKAPHCSFIGILGSESLSAIAVDNHDKLLALENWEYPHLPKSFEQAEREVRTILKQEPIFQLPFGQKHVALSHPNITLIPRRLFQHGKLPDYFHLVLPPGEYMYSYEELPEFDAYLVCATEKSQARLFSDFFPDARFRHNVTPVLRYVRKLAAVSEHTVFVNLRAKMAQIAVLERQNLLFFNTFHFSTPSDLLYYVLLAYDQFRLNPMQKPLTLAGNILKDSELYRILFRFVREVRFATPPVHIQLPPEMESLQAHCLTDLLCLKNS
ncbi:MAG: DUF3822 family protein [Lewinellaceae bacterium]|nr:DUF3822 family protein [Saprospiraceae bacterium]MCB9329533.1 DUF3822 family protein [Lewinellaceae bacterium]